MRAKIFYNEITTATLNINPSSKYEFAAWVEWRKDQTHPLKRKLCWGSEINEYAQRKIKQLKLNKVIK